MDIQNLNFNNFNKIGNCMLADLTEFENGGKIETLPFDIIPYINNLEENESLSFIKREDSRGELENTLYKEDIISIQRLRIEPEDDIQYKVLTLGCTNETWESMNITNCKYVADYNRNFSEMFDMDKKVEAEYISTRTIKTETIVNAVIGPVIDAMTKVMDRDYVGFYQISRHKNYSITTSIAKKLISELVDSKKKQNDRNIILDILSKNNNEPDVVKKKTLVFYLSLASAWNICKTFCVSNPSMGDQLRNELTNILEVATALQHSYNRAKQIGIESKEYDIETQTFTRGDNQYYDFNLLDESIISYLLVLQELSDRGNSVAIYSTKIPHHIQVIHADTVRSTGSNNPDIKGGTIDENISKLIYHAIAFYGDYNGKEDPGLYLSSRKAIIKKSLCETKYFINICNAIDMCNVSALNSVLQDIKFRQSKRETQEDMREIEKVVFEAVEDMIQAKIDFENAVQNNSSYYHRINTSINDTILKPVPDMEQLENFIPGRFLGQIGKFNYGLGQADMLTGNKVCGKLRSLVDKDATLTSYTKELMKIVIKSAIDFDYYDYILSMGIAPYKFNNKSLEISETPIHIQAKAYKELQAISDNPIYNIVSSCKSNTREYIDTYNDGLEKRPVGEALLQEIRNLNLGTQYNIDNSIIYNRNEVIWGRKPIIDDLRETDTKADIFNKELLMFNSSTPIRILSTNVNPDYTTLLISIDAGMIRTWWLKLRLDATRGDKALGLSDFMPSDSARMTEDNLWATLDVLAKQNYEWIPTGYRCKEIISAYSDISSQQEEEMIVNSMQVYNMYTRDCCNLLPNYLLKDIGMDPCLYFNISNWSAWKIDESDTPKSMLRLNVYSYDPDIDEETKSLGYFNYLNYVLMDYPKRPFDNTKAQELEGVFFSLGSFVDTMLQLSYIGLLESETIDKECKEYNIEKWNELSSQFMYQYGMEEKTFCLINSYDPYQEMTNTIMKHEKSVAGLRVRKSNWNSVLKMKVEGNNNSDNVRDIVNFNYRQIKKDNLVHTGDEYNFCLGRDNVDEKKKQKDYQRIGKDIVRSINQNSLLGGFELIDIKYRGVVNNFQSYGTVGYDPNISKLFNPDGSQDFFLDSKNICQAQYGCCGWDFTMTIKMPTAVLVGLASDTITYSQPIEEIIPEYSHNSGSAAKFGSNSFN